MASRTDERRTALKSRLIDAAERCIVAEGHHSIRARDLAAEAGCAVGAIYNIYADLSELVMEVNGRTFHRLGAQVSRAVESSGKSDPVEQLVVMGRAYLEFASSNTNAWRTLFDLEMSAESEVPEWYLAEMQMLFDLITAPLLRLNPDADHAEIGLITRALFSSVHGIVLLGHEKRISGVPVEEMARMIEIIVRKIAN